MCEGGECGVFARESVFYRMNFSLRPAYLGCIVHIFGGLIRDCKTVVRRFTCFLFLFDLFLFDRLAVVVESYGCTPPDS